MYLDTVGFFITLLGGGEKLRTFPIPTYEKNQELLIVKKVKQILSTKRSNPQADTKALEDEIDLLVYHLYDLTYDEVLVIDPELKLSKEAYERKKRRTN